MESTSAVRLPVPLSKLHERYPEVAVELRTGASRELTAQVLSGDLDAALVADPVSEARLEAEAVFKENLVLVAGPKHSSIASPTDVRPRTVLAFHAGCSYRKRLEDWFSEAGVPIERVIELASYHTILGCAATGIGVALVPRSVLDIFAEPSRLSVHELKPKFRRTQTLLIWRKQFPQSKIAALKAILTEGDRAPQARSNRLR